MTEAARILGTDVSSTAPVFLAVLAVHVLAGLTAVVTSASSTVLAALTAMRPRADYHLALIGLVAYTAATIGYLHRRRHRPGDAPHIIAMGVSYIAMLTAFYVDNGPHLPLWNRLPSLSFWLLPSLIGVAIIVRALGRRTPLRGYAGRRRR
jgi:hypothetical protein